MNETHLDTFIQASKEMNNLELLALFMIMIVVILCFIGFVKTIIHGVKSANRRKK